MGATYGRQLTSISIGGGGFCKLVQQDKSQNKYKGYLINDVI